MSTSVFKLVEVNRRRVPVDADNESVRIRNVDNRVAAGLAGAVNNNDRGLATAALPYAFEVIARIASRLDIDLDLEPDGREAARLRFPSGRVAYFRHGNLDINGSGAADIARDKRSCAYFLALAGLPVPPTCAVLRDSIAEPPERDRITAFAAEHGWPLIVKPNSLYGGRGVEKVTSPRTLRQALDEALRIDKIALVQPYVRGHDVRVVVFDGEVMAAYCRIPPAVVGDGVRTIEQLVQDYFASRVPAAGRQPDLRETVTRLARRDDGLARIPCRGEPVLLVDAANFATGAHVVNVLHHVSPDVLDLAVVAANASGLRLAGVDLLVDVPAEILGLPHDGAGTGAHAIWSVPSTGRCVVLEINGAPELDGVAALGSDQAGLVERLYERVLMELAGIDVASSALARGTRDEVGTRQIRP